MPRELHPLRVKPDGVLRPRFAFVDVEASGLHKGSFPIEVGISDDGLNVETWLIKPPRQWTLANWSLQSQVVHGISWRQLQEEGRPVEEVAEALDRRLSRVSVLSDAPGYDAAWLSVLYAALGRPMPFSVLQEAEAVASLVADGQMELEDAIASWESAIALSGLAFPHTHHAGDDARSMAAAFRMVIDEGFMIEVAASLG